MATAPTAVAANPRAAYPPRKGHIECLHRAGAAGGDGVVLRGVPRPRGPASAIAQRIHRKAVRLAKGLEKRASRWRPTRSSTRSRWRWAPLQTVVLKSAVDEGINLRRVGRTASASRSTRRTRPADHRGGVARLRHPQATPMTITDPEYRLPEALMRTTDYPDPSGLPHEPGRDRDDALHAPAGRPRPGARPGDDPAWLVHDEAERAAEMMPISWREFR
jgi:glycine dehydrogenase